MKGEKHDLILVCNKVETVLMTFLDVTFVYGLKVPYARKKNTEQIL